MATKKEIIDIQVKYGSLQGLNKELQKTNEELEQTQIGSERFKELSKEAQKLTSAIEATNQEVEGMTADKKFMAMNGAVKVFAGGVAAATGTLGMLGVESEKLGKFQEHAASALAFGVGLKDVSEGYSELAKSGKLAEIQTKAVSAATKAWAAVQKGFNAVMAMNPLGILIVSLTTAGVLIYKFRDQILNFIKTALGPFKFIIDGITSAFSKLGEAVGLVDDAQTKATKANIERMETELAVAQAKGEATIEMEKQLLLEKRKLLKEGTDEYKESLKQEKVLDGQAWKEQQDLLKEKQKAKDDADKVADDKRKAQAEKDAQFLKDQQQKGLDLLEKYQQEELDLLAKTDQEKLDLEYKRQLAEIDALKISEEEKNRIKLEAEQNYHIKSQELTDAANDVKLQKQLEREQTEADRQLELQYLEAETLIQQRDAEIADVTAQYDRMIAEAKKNGEDITTLEKLKTKELELINDDYRKAEADKDAQEREAKLAGAMMATDAIQGALSELFGESKAIASANVLVDAGQAAVGIIKSSQSIPAPFNIPFQVAQFATLAATTAKSLKEINSAQPGKGGTPSRPQVQGPRMSTQGPPPIPQGFEPPQQTQVQPVVKAYVVSGDVRSSNEAEAKISARRTLG